MSGSIPPDRKPGGELPDKPSDERHGAVADDGGFPAHAYSAPEAEHYSSSPYIPVDPGMYDFDAYESYDPDSDLVDDPPQPPKWPWVVGITAIIAAIALVVSVSLLVTSTDTNKLATPATTTVKPPPVQDEITTQPPPPPPPTEEPPPPPPTEEPPPPPPETVTVTPEPPPPPASTEPPPAMTTTTAPPPTTSTTPAGPRQVTYSVTGTKAPGDIISVTYVDASGRRRTQRNVYIPWSLTVTPISQSDVGSVQASSLFLVSKLNCAITTNDGTVLSSNNGNAAQTSC